MDIFRTHKTLVQNMMLIYNFFASWQYIQHCWSQHLNHNLVEKLWLGCSLPLHGLCFSRSILLVDDIPMGIKGHPLLCHYLLYKDALTHPWLIVDELLFLIKDYQISFDKRALCVVTRLHSMEYFVTCFLSTQFRHHKFQFVLTSKTTKVVDL